MIEAHFKNQTLVYNEIRQPAYQFAIIKHRPRDNSGGDPSIGGFDIRFSPDTIPMQDRPKGTGKGNTIPILNPWWEYMKKINTPEGYIYNRSIGCMWINIWYDQETDTPTPKAESIHCGGNFIAYEEETSTHVKLISYDYRMKTVGLDPEFDNWHMKPYLFWKAVAIDIGGKMIMPVVLGEARDVYFPLIRRTELWMNKKDLEFFPAPPKGMTYELRGVNVFGRIGKDLVPLLTVRNRIRTFHTDWFRLSTEGVIPPADTGVNA